MVEYTVASGLWQEEDPDWVYLWYVDDVQSIEGSGVNKPSYSQLIPTETDVTFSCTIVNTSNNHNSASRPYRGDYCIASPEGANIDDPFGLNNV